MVVTASVVTANQESNVLVLQTANAVIVRSPLKRTAALKMIAAPIKRTVVELKDVARTASVTTVANANQ